MRFAVITTAVAAAVALPFAVAAAGPQMSSDEFISAVRCAAYEDLTTPAPGPIEAKWQLNAEARRQSTETAARAQAEVSNIARSAYAAEPGAVSEEHAAACAEAELAAGADSQERA